MCHWRGLPEVLRTTRYHQLPTTGVWTATTQTTSRRRRLLPIRVIYAAFLPSYDKVPPSYSVWTATRHWFTFFCVFYRRVIGSNSALIRYFISSISPLLPYISPTFNCSRLIPAPSLRANLPFTPRLHDNGNSFASRYYIGPPSVESIVITNSTYSGTKSRHVHKLYYLSQSSSSMTVILLAMPLHLSTLFLNMPRFVMSIRGSSILKRPWHVDRDEISLSMSVRDFSLIKHLVILPEMSLHPSTRIQRKL